MNICDCIFRMPTPAFQVSRVQIPSILNNPREYAVMSCISTSLHYEYCMNFVWCLNITFSGTKCTPWKIVKKKLPTKKEMIKKLECNSFPFKAFASELINPSCQSSSRFLGLYASLGHSERACSLLLLRHDPLPRYESRLMRGVATLIGNHVSFDWPTANYPTMY